MKINFFENNYVYFFETSFLIIFFINFIFYETLFLIIFFLGQKSKLLVYNIEDHRLLITEKIFQRNSIHKFCGELKLTVLNVLSLFGMTIEVQLNVTLFAITELHKKTKNKILRNSCLKKKISFQIHTSP